MGTPSVNEMPRPVPSASRAMTRPSWVDDRLYPFQSRLLEVDGQPMHYVDEGDPRGPAQLFLGGGFGWSFTFRHYILGLRGRFRCIAPDYPGFGPSPGATARPPTAASLSRVVEGFVDALDLRDVTLWVNDVGGPVGLGAAVRQPERYRALVIGGTFGWSLEGEPRVARMLRLAGSRPFTWAHRHTNLLPRTMGSASLGTRTLSRPERAQYTAPFADRRRRDHALALLRSLADDPAHLRSVERGLAGFRDRPALLLFGTKDAATGFGWPGRWERTLPRARLAMLPGVKHFPFEDAPGEVLRRFREWWPGGEATSRG